MIKMDNFQYFSIKSYVVDVYWNCRNIMGHGPVCYIPKFMEIEPLVQRDKILRFFKT